MKLKDFHGNLNQNDHQDLSYLMKLILFAGSSILNEYNKCRPFVNVRAVGQQNVPVRQKFKNVHFWKQILQKNTITTRNWR